MATNYFLKLDRFEGPLDVLLQLIKINEFSIFDINLYTLTSQYLDFLRTVQFRDLNEAAGFIEMAATLIDIKTFRLVPGNEEKNRSESEDEDNLEEQLERKLILYDTFKRATQTLSERANFDAAQQYAPQAHLEVAEEFVECDVPLCGDSSVLLVLYEQMLVGLSEKRPQAVQLTTDAISIDEVIEKLQALIGSIRFLLFQGVMEESRSRYEMVANILAMLQLARDRKIGIHQETLFGPMWCYDADLSLDQVEKNIEESQQ